jgi:hypothetical protein
MSKHLYPTTILPFLLKRSALFSVFRQTGLSFFAKFNILPSDSRI